MKQLDKTIKDILNYVEEMTGKSPDFVKRRIKIGQKEVAYFYLESVTSDDKVSNYLMKSLSQDVKTNKITLFENLFKELQNTIPNSKVKLVDNYEELFYHLTSGFTCLIVDGHQEAITFETKMILDRGVSESNTETVIRGPKDSFTENHMINLGLIRKRIKDPNLWFEEEKVGRRTKTKVSIAYIRDIADKEKVDLLKKKLSEIDIDGILDSGYIRELLIGGQNSFFPKVISTERPDIVCGSLLEGKIAIIVENTPIVLVYPGLFVDFFHTPEDYYQKPGNVTFTRILRVIAFLVTLLVPSIYIAIMTFNQEVIPDQLLISLAIQREGVPFPTAFEVLFLGITFEVLRESDIRLPNVMGTAVSIVGALVLGEAAVSAGIISPIVLIIVALTSISGLLFSDIDVINAIRWWRLLFILAATFMGLVGIVVAGIFFVIKLASLECLGIPYLSPFAPFNFIGQKDAIVRTSRKKMKKRPSFLTKKNPNRMEDPK